MENFKHYFKIAMAAVSAIVLAPLIAFFGLIMLGLTFGLSLLAVAGFAKAARDFREQQTDEEDTFAS